MLLAVAGCRPRSVLSNREMRDVLYDMHRADAAIQVAGYNYAHDIEVAGYYKNVLDKYGITQAQFDSSLVWYTNNPQIFNKIYPKVLERLEADFECEKQLREAKKGKLLAQAPQRKLDSEVAKKQIREKLDMCQKGYPNPWKEWQAEDFCEKDVVIFGQVSADALASTDTLVTSRAPISSLKGTQPPRSYGR